MSSSDIIDLLVGVDASSHLGAVREERPQARENAQASYRALFEPRDPGGVTAQERFALAAFVAGLHRQPALQDFYRDKLVALRPSPDLLVALDAETARGETQGPYGAYPKGPLSAEDVAGLVFAVSEPARAPLGARLAAAFAHAHLLVFRPRDASGTALKALLDAGWSTAEIVTLSQLVAFLAFQIRSVVGLSVLATTARA